MTTTGQVPFPRALTPPSLPPSPLHVREGVLIQTGSLMQSAVRGFAATVAVRGS